MTPIYEAEVEDWVIDLLQEQGYSPLSAEEQEAGRDGFSDLLLRRRTLLYNGDHCLSFGTGIYAVLLSALWE